MSQTTNPNSEARAVIDAMRDLHKVEVVRIEDDNGVEREVLAVPRGVEIQGTKKLHDEWLQRPERREGVAILGDLPSFIAHANRFKAANSAIFAHRDERKPGIQTIFDYHPEGPLVDHAEWRRHRGSYSFPLSEPWRAWAAIDGQALSQRDFAAFIEDRVMDVLPPPDKGEQAGALTSDLLALLGGEIAGPTRLLEVARGLRMTETSEVANAQNLATGEVEIVYRTTHTGAAGQPLKVPNLFVVGMPVFDGDAAYRLPIKLQYRRVEGKIVWTIKRYRPDLVFFDAFDRATAKVAEETKLPLFIGAPE